MKGSSPMKKCKLITIILITVILTTSCWSRREIEDLGFIMAMGISKTDEGLYSMVLQLANAPSLIAEAPDPRTVYSILKSEGLTPFDALRNLSKVGARRTYLSHLQVLIIDEALAKEGIGEIVGFLAQDREIRLEFDVLISKVPPENILDTPNTRGLLPANVLKSLSDNYGTNSKIFVTDLHEAIEAVNNPVINYVTTLVEKKESPTDHEKDFLKLTQIAVFDNDKLKGYLDNEEGQGFNFITNNFKNGLIIFEYNTNKDKITIEILESTVSITPNYIDEKVGFDIELKISGNVAERVSETNEAIELDIEIVQKQLTQVLEDKLRKSIVTAQEKFEVDYFNLSKDFSRKYPNEFKEIKDDWNTVFSNANISIKVDASVVHSALNLNRGRM